MKLTERSHIGSVLGFQQTDDLGVYLGAPLFHFRVKQSTFQFIIDKVQSKLNSYDAKLLSLARRTMLAKSVLLTIPGYFMQSSMISVRVCEWIEQIMRRFFWVRLKMTGKYR